MNSEILDEVQLFMDRTIQKIIDQCKERPHVSKYEILNKLSSYYSNPDDIKNAYEKIKSQVVINVE